MHLQLPSPSRVTSLLPSTPQAASSGAELVTSDGRALALVGAHLRGEARGGLARLVLEQRFENASDEDLRVTYRMPIPADGAVSGYAFVIGERTITGVVDRKRAARARFEQAIIEGRTAALLEQERADIFTQQIGNISPRTTVIARITIDQRLTWLPEGEWELRFPTVIGPRYIGAKDTADDVRATHVKVSDRPLIARIQLEIAIGDAIAGGARPSSPSHAIAWRDDRTVELAEGARLDRDLVVRWAVARPEVGLSLATARPSQGHGDDAYALLTIVPPAKAAHATPVPRDLIVLLDTSGSMDGGPLDKAKQVVAMMIDSLDERDRLELIEFSSEPRRWRDEPLVATARVKHDAIQWVRSRRADGGTEMRAAVIEALTTLRVGAQRQVVVVTDGYVGGEHQILEALNRRLPRSCRLHVLGVGSAVNRSIASALARAGRGAEVIVGLDEDAERGARRLLDRTRAPMLTNVELTGGALLRHAPAQVPDVFAGAPLVAALAVRASGGELIVRGQLAHDTWEQRIAVPAQRPGDGNQAIVALYGRERVADVEATAMFRSIDATGGAAPRPTGGAGVAPTPLRLAPLIDGEIEDLGLTFQIATRLTSWVAIDEIRRATGPVRDDLIPQELPYGTSAAAFGLRRAAMTETRAGGIAMPAMASLASYAPTLADDADADYDEESSSLAAESFPPRLTAPTTKLEAAGITGRHEQADERPAPVASPHAKPTRAALAAPTEAGPAARRRGAPGWLAVLGIVAVLAAIVALLWWLLR
jgi:Ca-activated chloride channel homolog